MTAQKLVSVITSLRHDTPRCWHPLAIINCLSSWRAPARKLCPEAELRRDYCSHQLPWKPGVLQPGAAGWLAPGATAGERRETPSRRTMSTAAGARNREMKTLKIEWRHAARRGWAWGECRVESGVCGSAGSDCLLRREHETPEVAVRSSKADQTSEGRQPRVETAVRAPQSRSSALWTPSWSRFVCWRRAPAGALPRSSLRRPRPSRACLSLGSSWTCPTCRRFVACCSPPARAWKRLEALSDGRLGRLPAARSWSAASTRRRWPC